MPARKRPERAGFLRPGAILPEPIDRNLPGQLAAASEIKSYFSKYTAVANVVVDHWMPEVSGSEFKVLLLFIRDTIGQEAKRSTGCLSSELTVEQIRKRTGLNKESVIIAIKGLEATGGGLIVVERNHRKTSRYRLNLTAVMEPWVGKSDSRAVL